MTSTPITISTSPNQPPAVAYEVVESQLIPGPDDTQAAVVGRSSDGVHLVLTHAAAERLAGIVNAHVAIAKAQGEPAGFWCEIVSDLDAAAAAPVHAGAHRAVTVGLPGRSGYLPRRVRRLAPVDAGART